MKILFSSNATNRSQCVWPSMSCSVTGSLVSAIFWWGYSSVRSIVYPFNILTNKPPQNGLLCLWQNDSFKNLTFMYRIWSKSETFFFSSNWCKFDSSSGKCICTSHSFTLTGQSRFSIPTFTQCRSLPSLMWVFTQCCSLMSLSVDVYSVIVALYHHSRHCVHLSVTQSRRFLSVAL